jgi:hypothetical protein
MEFKNDIQKYYEIDDEISQHLEKIKTLRSKRTDLTNNIINYADNNDLCKSTISLDEDTKFKIISVKSHSSITFKYLEQSLNTIIGDKSKVDIIIKYLKDNRLTTENRLIKRY